jgi:hypothetical protein
MDSTKFYSTKLQENVFIPKNKTCGYRIRNDYMTKGYSSGLKAGLDNGVVNQRLSRFSTDLESEQAKTKCDGNTNWYNHKPGSNLSKPNPTDDNRKIFQLKRPAFIADYEPDFYKPIFAEDISNINQRHGNVYGNHDIQRPASLVETPLARMAVNFDKLQAIDLQNFGAKVQLSDKTLKQIFNIEIPDPLDTKWLDEKNRIVDNLKIRGFSDKDILNHLEANKPLGRPQRTNTQKGNIGNSVLSLSNKLSEILEEIRQGRGNSQTQRSELIGQLALSLSDTAEIIRLTDEGNNKLKGVISTLNIPTDSKDLGLPNRFIGNEDYQANKGLVNAHIINKAENSGLDIMSPVVNEAGEFLGLDEVERELQNGKMLDIMNSAILSQDNLEGIIGASAGLLQSEISPSLTSQLEQSSEKKIQKSILSGSRQGEKSLAQMLSLGRKGLTNEEVTKLKEIGSVQIDPVMIVSQDSLDDLISDFKEDIGDEGKHDTLSDTLDKSRSNKIVGGISWKDFRENKEIKRRIISRAPEGQISKKKRVLTNVPAPEFETGPSTIRKPIPDVEETLIPGSSNLSNFRQNQLNDELGRVKDLAIELNKTSIASLTKKELLDDNLTMLSSMTQTGRLQLFENSGLLERKSQPTPKKVGRVPRKRKTVKRQMGNGKPKLSKWITHVKNYCAKNKCSYKDGMSRAKASYK